MYLSSIKLWNFRKFGPSDLSQPHAMPSLQLHFHQGLNVIVGENDAGKSAIIDAIKLVLKTHSYDYIRADHKDFYKGTTRFRIEISFAGLEAHEAKNFTEWLGWQGEGEAATPYLRLVLDVQKKEDYILPYESRAGVDNDCYPLTAEAKELLKLTYLKPLRDAESELIARKNSRLSQILVGDGAFKGKQTHELVEVFNDFSKGLKDYFTNPSHNHEGGKIKRKIDTFIKDFYDKEQEVDFRTADGEVKSILEKLTLALKDEINPGLGSLNRLCMAAELLHLSKEHWSGLRLGLIEEVEAHLHPQAQMQVIETLQKLTQIQLILTTHSPHLASKVKLHNLILCTNNYAYPLHQKYTKLRSTDYPFLERFLDVTKSNLFFARGVILVEGAAEEMILPALAKKLCELKITDRDLTAAKVSVVPINNTAFNRYANVFKRRLHPHIKMPVAIINDLDLRPTEYAITYKIKKKRRKQELIVTEYDKDAYQRAKAQKIEEQNVKAFISPYWTLEYCLAMHPYLRKLLFRGIYQAIEESRADHYVGNVLVKQQIRRLSLTKLDTYWEAFIANKSPEQIAFDIMYRFIIDNKKLSKAIIAQYFAELLCEDDLTAADLIIADNPIAYLIDAIKYATAN